MIVEDDDRVRTVLRLALEGEGHTESETASAETGDGVEPVAGGSAPHQVRIGPDGLLLAGSPGFLEARSSRPRPIALLRLVRCAPSPADVLRRILLTAARSGVDGAVVATVPPRVIRRRRRARAGRRGGRPGR